MIRTKHAFLFSVGIGVVLLVVLISVLFSKDTNVSESTNAPIVVGEVPTLGVMEQFNEARKNIKESLIARLQKGEGTFDIPEEVSGTEDEGVGAEVVSTSSILGGEVPRVSVTIGGITQEGTLGSYCWDGVCSDSAVTETLYPPVSVGTTSLITFALEASEQPERIFLFVREKESPTTTISRELSQIERQGQQFMLTIDPGEYIFFITGVWQGGDVAHMFSVVH